MNQRITDLIDHGPVQFRFFTLDDQVYLFTQAMRQIADHPWKAVEYLTYRNHPQFHDHTLQIGGYPVHLLNRFTKFLQLVGQSDLLQARFIDNQLADQIQQ